MSGCTKHIVVFVSTVIMYRHEKFLYIILLEHILKGVLCVWELKEVIFYIRRTKYLYPCLN